MMENICASNDTLHGYYFDELDLGMSESFGKTITDADITLFAGVSCDTNPLHLNYEFAKKTMFKSTIAHGILTASLISAVIGTKLPGPGSIYISQSLNFRAPVFSGDTILAHCTITNLLPDRYHATLKTECLVNNTIVLDGQAIVKVPNRP